jgi:hypothetical protein
MIDSMGSSRVLGPAQLGFWSLTAMICHCIGRKQVGSLIIAGSISVTAPLTVLPEWSD